MAADMASKLQLKPGRTVTVIGAPEGYAAALAAQLPANPLSADPAPADAVLLFVTRRADAPAQLLEAAALLGPGGLLWLAYPKGGAAVPTDLNRDRLWQAVEATGWRPVRQVALDETWSGMRFRPAAEVGR